MKRLYIIVLISSCIYGSNVVEFQHKSDEKPAESLDLSAIFTRYQEKYGVVLSQDEKHTLLQSYRSISSHNADPANTHKLEINAFAHLTFQQFKSKMLMSSQNCSATKTSSDIPIPSTTVRSLNHLPKFKDWRIEGNYVTPVKNQGHCGSCWTFSTTGCLESAWAVHRKELVSLSEQQLIDCAGNFDNHGCSGGLPSHAFEYIHQNNGIDTENGYSYEGVEEGKCSFSDDDGKISPVQVKGSFNITSGDEEALFQAVTYLNPVSIAYEVVDDFMLYSGGVYEPKTCKQGPMDVNHAVLIVGYGTDSKGTDYWIVKNSWGPSWGMDGYFWIKRGVNACGLAVCASFPIVD